MHLRTSSESFQISTNVTIQRILFRHGGMAKMQHQTVTFEMLALEFARMSNNLRHFGKVHSESHKAEQ